MQISKISQAMQSELRKIDGSARKQEKEQPAASKASISDRSELSEDGQKQRAVKGDMQIISSMVRAQPDVRAERVAEAKMNISAGIYNTGEFIDRLAGKLAGAMA